MRGCEIVVVFRQKAFNKPDFITVDNVFGYGIEIPIQYIQIVIEVKVKVSDFVVLAVFFNRNRKNAVGAA